MTLDSSPTHNPPSIDSQTIEAAIDAMPRIGISRWALIVLFVVFFLGTYENAILAIALPSMTQGLGLTASALAVPVSMNLLGFAIGSYIVGYLADRYGRQLGLRVTFIVLGVGSLASALAWDVGSLSVFRFLAGCGMGAVLSIISGYIGEMAPLKGRGGIIARISVMATVLIAASSLAAVPLVTSVPLTAWRILFAIGAVSLLLLPFVNRRDIVESPRWLVEHGALGRAEAIVRMMEKRSRGAITAANVTFVEPEVLIGAGTQTPGKTLFSSRLLVGRLVVITAVLFLFYIGFFGVNTYLTIFLEKSGIPSSVALSITAVSRIAGLVAAIALIFVIESIERKFIIAIGMGLMVVGVLLVVLGLGAGPATIGAFVMAFGTGVIAPAAFTYTAEIFPTRVRATASSIADGVGHLGGAVTPFVILPLLVLFGPLAAGLAVIGLLLVAAVMILFGVRTRGRTLEEIAL